MHWIFHFHVIANFIQIKCGYIFRKVVYIFSDSLRFYISVHWTVSCLSENMVQQEEVKDIGCTKNKKVDSGNKEGGYTEEVKALVCQCAEWMCVLSVVYIPICIAAQYPFTSTLFIPLLKMNLYPRYSFGQLLDSTDVGFCLKKACHCYWKEAFQVEEVN